MNIRLTKDVCMLKTCLINLMEHFERQAKKAKGKNEKRYYMSLVRYIKAFLDYESTRDINNMNVEKNINN